MDQKQLQDYSDLKVFAMLLVVLGHITRFYSGDGVVTPQCSSSVLSYLTAFIYSFHMPLFVSISGAIYYYQRFQRANYSNLFGFVKKKALRLLLPYLVFGFCYVAPIMILFHFIDGGYFSYIKEGIIYSHNSQHLWYVLMLFDLFIIFRFGEKIILKLPEPIMLFCGFFLYIFSFAFPGRFQVRSAAQYLIFFYIGFLFQKNRNEITSFFYRKSSVLLVLSLISTILLVSLLQLFEFPTFIIRILSLSVAFTGMLMSYLLMRFVTDSVRTSLLYNCLKKDSFGIYLFHPIIIYILFYYTAPYKINPFLLTLTIFILSSSLSIILVYLVRKIKLGIIIGE